MGWGLGCWLAGSAYKIKDDIQQEIYETKENFSLIDSIGKAIGFVVVGFIIVIILLGIFEHQ